MKRADRVLSDIQALVNEPVVDLVISERLEKDGSRIHEALWAFTKSYVIEAKNFGAEDDFDFMKHLDGFVYVRMKKSNYLPLRADSTSRLSFEATNEGPISVSMHASGENCDHMWKVITKYVLRDLWRSSEAIIPSTLSEGQHGSGL